MRTEETGGGWLVDQDVLHHQRAPGTTCLSALYEGGRGTPVKPLNDSKGCGGVMRVAPIALVTEHRFATAARAAALTHGHPSGYLSSGAFAHVVGELLRGATLPDAIASARVELVQWPDHDETMRSIDAAVALAASGVVDAERIETLGGGWVGEEALAIGLCCALVAPDVRSGLELAVNHSGDSDSTGSIAGNLLGALHGVDALPADLLGQIERSPRSSRPWPAISPMSSSTGVRSTAPATRLAEHGRRDAAVDDRPLARTGFSWYR